MAGEPQVEQTAQEPAAGEPPVVGDLPTVRKAIDAARAKQVKTVEPKPEPKAEEPPQAAEPAKSEAEEKPEDFEQKYKSLQGVLTKTQRELEEAKGSKGEYERLSGQIESLNFRVADLMAAQLDAIASTDEVTAEAQAKRQFDLQMAGLNLPTDHPLKPSVDALSAEVTRGDMPALTAMKLLDKILVPSLRGTAKTTAAPAAPASPPPTEEASPLEGASAETLLEKVLASDTLTAFTDRIAEDVKKKLNLDGRYAVSRGGTSSAGTGVPTKNESLRNWIDDTRERKGG